MKVFQEMEIRSNKWNNERSGEKNEFGFHKIDGVVFCKDCGKKYKESEINGNCLNCNCSDFLKGEIASTLAGYLKLMKDGHLKDYYDGRFKKSAARMNPRRMIVWLLVKDGLILPADKRAEDMVYRTLRKNGN